MMDPEKTRKFEALKIEIRSILITYKRGCTEAQLQSDYAKFNGKQLIPYGEFGCTTLLDMLRAMPDAALINNYSNPPMIHGVADEKTEHIQNLVSHQASAGSRNRGRFRMPRPNLNFRYPPVIFLLHFKFHHFLIVNLEEQLIIVRHVFEIDYCFV